MHHSDLRKTDGVTHLWPYLAFGWACGWDRPSEDDPSCSGMLTLKKKRKKANSFVTPVANFEK